MKFMLNTFVLLTALSTSACSKPQVLESLYDYQVNDPQGKALTLDELAESIESVDVVLVGEWHGHPGIHKFQTDLLVALSTRRNDVALSMEQFSRDTQSLVEQYLDSELGEDVFKREARAWENYDSDYRPLIEVAKARGLDVIAANAPKRYVRCVGKEGLVFLDKLPPQKRAWFADKIDTSDSPYKDTFFSAMHHGNEQQTLNQYSAQLSWDATMAESIINYIAANRNTTVYHIAGRFHVAEGLGIAGQIHQRDPSLKIMVVTPVHEGINLPESAQDIRLNVLPLPQRWLSEDEMMASMKEMRSSSEQKDVCHLYADR